MTVCQKLDMILKNKVVQRLKLEKIMFLQKKWPPKRKQNNHQFLPSKIEFRKKSFTKKWSPKLIFLDIFFFFFFKLLIDF